MKGLTLHRPWPWAILYLGKRIENRSWMLPRHIMGNQVAIHAGAGWDARGAEWISARFSVAVPPEHDHPKFQIVGLAKMTDCLMQSNDPWFFGPYGWTFDFIPVAPIPMKGAQGLWGVPQSLVFEEIPLPTLAQITEVQKNLP